MKLARSMRLDGTLGNWCLIVRGGVCYLNRGALSLNEGGRPPGNIHVRWWSGGKFDPFFRVALWLPWKKDYWILSSYSPPHMRETRRGLVS